MLPSGSNQYSTRKQAEGQAISNIVKFPKVTKPLAIEPLGTPAATASTTSKTEGLGLPADLVKFVWVVTVLIYPILKWALSIEVFFQFVRMLYHWNTPGVLAR